MKLIPFGSICSLQNGRAFKPEDWSVEGVPIIRIQNLNDHAKPFNYCNLEIERQFHINSGDLLFSWSGTPGTSFGAFFWNRGKGYLNQHIFRVDVDEKKVDKIYLRYAVNSKLDEIIDQAHGGVGLKHITKGKLEAVLIPLPPLPIQRHIARVLDQADQLRKQAQQMETELNALAQSVFLEMFGDPVKNPKGWKSKALKDFAFIQIGPFGTQLHKEDYVIDGIPLINPMHINNQKITPQNNFTITKEKHEELPEYHLKKGDVIMGRRGEMGRCALVTEIEQGWLCGTGSLFIRTKYGESFGSYLQKYLSSDYIKSYLEAEAKGATMPNLNKTIIGNIVVPLPKEDCLSKFSQMKFKIDELIKVNKQIEADTLFHSLVQKAFKGELIPTTMEEAA